MMTVWAAPARPRARPASSCRQRRSLAVAQRNADRPACLHAVVAIVRDVKLAVVHRGACRLSELALAAALVTEAEAPGQVCSERDDAVVVPVVEWHARVFSFLPTGLQVCEA